MDLRLLRHDFEDVPRTCWNLEASEKHRKQLHHQLPIGDPRSFPRLLLPYAIFPSASTRYKLMRRLQHRAVQKFQEPLSTVLNLFDSVVSGYPYQTPTMDTRLMDIGYTHLHTHIDRHEYIFICSIEGLESFKTFCCSQNCFFFLVFLTRMVQKPAANRRNHFPAT